jgi:DNA-binding Lrp family transcriptional regulator
VGASTLAALCVPPARLDEVAAVVSAFAEVNHNYAREHRYNLWFVVTAESLARVKEVLAEIQGATGLCPLDLPLVAEYHIDLGFAIQWN